MKLSQLFTVNAIVFIGLGIAFALYAPLMLGMFGILESEGSTVMYWYTTSFARLLGAALFGFGFVLWALRRQSTLPGVRTGVSLALTISYTLGFVVAITQQVSIWGTLYGWITAGVFLVLTAGYAYFLVKKNSE